MRFNPRPQRDQIIPVEPCSLDAEFAVELMALMQELMTMDEMKGVITRMPHEPGTQQFENWIVQVMTAITFIIVIT